MATEPRFRALRGGAELGSVALEVRAAGRRMLIDCGSTGRGDSGWTDEVGDLDAVWVGHAHLDHCGAIPDLWRGRPRLDAVATPPTASLVESVLVDHPDCDRDRAAALRSGFRAVSSGESFEFPALRRPRESGFVARAPSAGHLLGASMLWIELDDPGPPRRLLYTGDFCLHDQTVVPGADLQKLAALEVDTLVMEGVLATDEEADASEYVAELERLSDWAMAESGPTLVPAQASGEAVELAAGLAAAGADVAVDEDLESVLSEYRRYAGTPEVETLPESELTSHLFDGGTAVAPSDQLEPGTVSHRLASRVAERADGRIALVNRAYGSTPAGALLAADEGEWIRSLEGGGELRARVRRFVLPTHAPRRELVSLVRAVRPQRVVLVHGRESRLHALARVLRDVDSNPEVKVPGNGEVVFI